MFPILIPANPVVRSFNPNPNPSPNPNPFILVDDNEVGNADKE